MIKLVVMYKKPENPAEFDKAYFETHLPLANKMPGLRKTEIAKVTGTPQGDSEYYLVAELWFDNMDALKTALASEEGKASAKNLMSFAKGLFSMMFAEVVKEPVVLN